MTKTYEKNLRYLLANPPNGFVVIPRFRDDSGHHPEGFIEYECVFAAEMLYDLRPELWTKVAKLLDVGSYRRFVIGLTAGFNVTSIDVRRKDAKSVFEDCLVCDARYIQAEADSFDVVTSLCSIEHFGLGRYGDEFDIDGDRRAFDEMVRVLKPGGRLIFSTTITSGKPCICFNSHRIYDHQMILDLCNGLHRIDERIYKKGTVGFSKVGNETDTFGWWDIYMGCWQK